jgi:hypothetical protein
VNVRTLTFNLLSMIRLVEICPNLGGSRVLSVSEVMEMDEFAHSVDKAFQGAQTMRTYRDRLP